MAKIWLSSQLKIDQRTHQTQAKLFHALEMFCKNGLDYQHLTVSELCRQAKVGRATFYRHHQDIDDVIVVQFLILLADFENQVDALEHLNYERASILVVEEIMAHLSLFQMVSWSNTQAKVLAVIRGEVFQILALRDLEPERRQFVSDFLGSSLLTFAGLVAQQTISKAEALALYHQLIPDML